MKISAEIQEKAQNIHKNHLILAVASDKIVDAVFLRRPRPGDRVRMNGQTKLVKDLLSAARVPQRLRKDLPLLCDRDGILWVPTAGLDDRARPEKANCHRVIALSGSFFDELHTLQSLS